MGRSSTGVSKWTSLSRQAHAWTTWCQSYWRTMLALAALLFFPKLAAVVLAAMVRLAIRFIMVIMGRVIRETGSRVEWRVEPSGEPDFWCGASFCSTDRRLDAGVVTHALAFYHSGAISTPANRWSNTWWEWSYSVPTQALIQMLPVFNVFLRLRANRNGGMGNQSVVVLSLAATALEQHWPLTCVRTMMNHDWCSQERERERERSNGTSSQRSVSHE